MRFIQILHDKCISPALLFLETVPGILDKTAIGAKYCVGIGNKKNEELFCQMIGDVNVFCVDSVL